MELLAADAVIMADGGGKAPAIRGVLNPDKLRHLGPVADAARLLRERRAN